DSSLGSGLLVESVEETLVANPFVELLARKVRIHRECAEIGVLHVILLTSHEHRERIVPASERRGEHRPHRRGIVLEVVIANALPERRELPTTCLVRSPTVITVRIVVPLIPRSLLPRSGSPLRGLRWRPCRVWLLFKRIARHGLVPHAISEERSERTLHVVASALAHPRISLSPCFREEGCTPEGVQRGHGEGAQERVHRV